jgi:hypothetical protein
LSRWWIESRNLAPHNVIHHRQNLLEFIIILSMPNDKSLYCLINFLQEMLGLMLHLLRIKKKNWRILPTSLWHCKVSFLTLFISTYILRCYWYRCKLGLEGEVSIFSIQWVFLWHTDRKFGASSDQVMLIQIIQICFVSAVSRKLTVYPDIVWYANLWIYEWKVQWWPCLLLWQTLWYKEVNCATFVEFNKVEWFWTSTSEMWMKVCTQCVIERK